MTQDKTPKPPKTSQYTCSHRREMMLVLGLRQQLLNTVLTEAEKKKLEEEIARLEKEFDL